MDSTTYPKVKTMKENGLGCAPWLLALWRQRGVLELQDGTKKINKHFTYSHEPTQTKQQVG
jgi:hypothetical protein